MTGLQRLQYVATLIKDANDITPVSIGIDISHGEITDDMHGSFELILDKIKEEYGVLTFESIVREVVDKTGEMHLEVDYYIDTLAGFDEFYERLMQDGHNLPKPSTNTGSTVVYDDKHAKVSYGIRHVLLSPASSKQAFLFKHVYEANGRPVETDTIVSAYAFEMHDEEPSDRSFKDARLRINQ